MKKNVYIRESKSIHHIRYIVYGSSVIFRLLLIIWGVLQDRGYFIRDVPYTDIDYVVFSDAAREISHGGSPYDRTTYRYTPFLAWLLLPNVFLHPTWGKFLFSGADIIVGYLHERLLALSGDVTPETALRLASLWLLNPLAANICTRGSSDTLVSALLLATVLGLGTTMLPPQNKYIPSSNQQQQPPKQQRCSYHLVPGLLFGFAVHLRLYPIIYAPAFVLNLAHKSCVLSAATPPPSGSLFRKIRPQHLAQLLQSIFSRPVLSFVFASLSAFVVSSIVSIYAYGWSYVDHAVLYHLSRVDHRHNFSLFWYPIYLGMAETSRTTDGACALNEIGWEVSLLPFLIQAILLLSAALRYAQSDLIMCMFVQTAIFVTFNKVYTGQYFVWYLSLLPALLPRIRMSFRRSSTLLAIWVTSLANWLFWAYLLEMKGMNTFIQLYMASILFFFANVATLITTCQSYVPTTKEEEDALAKIQ
eukprot:503575_1